MKRSAFNTILNWFQNKPWSVIILAFVITLLSSGLAENLRLKMSFKDLMPQEHPTVKEYNQIIDNYNAASSIIIGAHGEKTELIDFVNELAQKIDTVDNIARVDFKINKKFITDHALMLTKAKDLKNSGAIYHNPALLPLITELNNSLEKSYLSKGEESLSTKEKENKAIASLDGIMDWLQRMEIVVKGTNSSENIAFDPDFVDEAVDKFLVGEEYFLSYDKNMILMFIKPTFPVDEMTKSTALIHHLDKIVEETKTNYKNIQLAGTTGTMALAVSETDAASEDMSFTSIISFVLIIILFIVSFRMWSAPLLATVSLLMGIIWTAGFATVTVGSLNMMTSMFGVILIGLGIDFNIHMISAYNENRAYGSSIEDSLKLSFKKSGKGIVVGALTTAMAFLTMLVTRNAGMKEFGLIAGFGVLFSMLASISVLPCMLIARDKIILRKTRKVSKQLEELNKVGAGNHRLKQKLEKKEKSLTRTKTINFTAMGALANKLAKRPVAVLSITLAITVLLVVSATRITFNYDYLSLQPEGLNCIAVQDSMIECYDATPDVVMVTAPSIERAHEITKKSKLLKKTGMVQSITDFVPSEKEYEKRLPYLLSIQKELNQYTYEPSLDAQNIDLFIDELYRLEDNLIELGQLAFIGGQERVDKKVKEIVGDLEVSVKERISQTNTVIQFITDHKENSLLQLNAFEKAYVPSFVQLARKMANPGKINIGSLPKDIYDRYTSINGENFLVSIYPKEQAWNFEFLSMFSDQMHKIDERVTGMPLVFYILINYIGKDGAIAAMLTLLVVFILLLIDFRSLKLALLTMIPLLLGTVWMIGVMQLMGVQLNILNVLGVPLILGIGIDIGVHIMHRYKIEGKHKLHIIFSSTGKAVLITTLSTFLAFGSMGFAMSRGLASLGITLSIGILSCYITTIVVMPAIIALLDKTHLKLNNK